MLKGVLYCDIPVPHESKEGGAEPGGGLRETSLVGGPIELRGEVATSVGERATEGGGRRDKRAREGVKRREGGL